MEVPVLEVSPVGTCIPKEHPVVGCMLPKVECEGAFTAVLVCCIGVSTRDAVWHDVEFGVWDKGTVAAL